MKKYFLIRKNGKVISVCDEAPVYDKNILDCRGLDISDEELDNLRHGHRAEFKKNKLNIYKSSHLIKSENVETIKQKIDNADDINKLKDIIKQLI